MKLLSKTNRYYMLSTALLLACGGVIFYFIISNIIKEEIGEVLENELSEYLNKIRRDTTWINFEKPIEFEISPTTLTNTADVFSDTLIQEMDDDELIPYLQLKVTRQIGKHNYQLILRESLIESEDILYGVSVSMIILFTILLFSLILLNNYLSRELWKPFYINLSKVKNYNLSQKDNLPVIPSDIQEFKELNLALVKMTERVQKDYLSLKEFTENASHEIQTPLAIIRSNIDWLIQHIQDEGQLSDLSKIEIAVNRISKTNQALLLLTKIENEHFTDLENIYFGNIIEQSLSDFEDFIQSKELSLSFEKNTDRIRLYNKTLIQILFTNLFSNAVKHNIQGGHINIILEEKKLVMENSGNPINVEPSRLFERFAKANQSTESTGLGLSIIKKICDVSGFEILYDYKETIHRITILF